MAADIFYTLLSFPLFIGMGRRELENIVTKTKFSFHTLHEGDTIVDTDTRSGMMVMLTDGTAVATTFSDDKGYRVEEEINDLCLYNRNTSLDWHSTSLSYGKQRLSAISSRLTSRRYSSSATTRSSFASIS